MTQYLTPFKSSVTLPVNTMSGSTIPPHLYPGRFMFGINFNGSPTNADWDKSIVIYTTDSVLNPKIGLSLPGATSFYGLYGMCRCAGVKIRYVPNHQNDTSSLVLWKPMFITQDYDGHEYDIVTTGQASALSTGKFKLKNMNRPWKTYSKSLKYKTFTKYPTGEQGDPTVGGQNIKGMWHGVGDAIAKSSGAYGCHIIGWLQDTTEGFHWGDLYITLYMVYKDRIN